MNWNPTDHIDQHPDIVLVFHGLMCLCNNDEGFCEIGIHNKDKRRHKFHIYVCEVSASFNPPVSTATGAPQLTPVATFDVNDTGATQDDEVTFDFENSHDPVAFLLREPRKSYPNDFSFMIDLEGPDFYADKELDKKSEALGPRLHVPYGVFYTLYKTVTEFKRVTGDADEDRLDIDSIARIVAANIYLDDGETVTITANNKSFPLTPTAAMKYLVVIDNGCAKQVCNYNPDDDQNDARRNDFHHYYDTFHIPHLMKKFKLKKKNAGPVLAVADDDFLQKLDKLLQTGGTSRSSDDSPCGAAGFGSSGEI